MLSPSSSFQYSKLKVRHKNASGNAKDGPSIAHNNNFLFGILVSSAQTERRISEFCRKSGYCKKDETTKRTRNYHSRQDDSRGRVRK